MTKAAPRKLLADIVEDRRSVLGWNKKVAAERCGLPYTTFVDLTIGRWKEAPSVNVLRALADGMGLPMYDLMEAAYGAPVLRGLRPAPEE